MMLKVSDKKKPAVESQYTKTYFKPVAILFDDRYENLKQCKAAYKKFHKEICIPVNLDDASWTTSDESKSQYTIMQIAEITQEIPPENQIKVSVQDGIFILYALMRFKIKDQDEIQKLNQKFSHVL